MFKGSVLIAVIFLSTCHGATFIENGRLAGGTEAEEGAAPYQVAILEKATNTFRFSGVLLSARSILTTANLISNVKPEDISIIVGTNEIFNGGSQYDIEDVLFHPEWSGFDKEVAILVVKGEIELSEKVKPIELSTAIIKENDIVTATGWGKINDNDNPTTLLTVDLQATNNALCKDYLISNYPYFFVYDSNFCTWKYVDQGVCLGDYGGPLVMDGKLVGMMSWSLRCTNDFLDVQTRISSVADWLTETMV